MGVLILLFSIAVFVAVAFANEEGVIASAPAPILTELYVCNSGDPNFLGKFSRNVEHLFEGVPVFTNDKGMSFFRSRGFWFLGDIREWPPRTHYRCVEHDDCNFEELAPPESGNMRWMVAKLWGKEPLPLVSYNPCLQSDQLEEL